MQGVSLLEGVTAEFPFFVERDITIFSLHRDIETFPYSTVIFYSKEASKRTRGRFCSLFMDSLPVP
jgi:hypothetical protein